MSEPTHVKGPWKRLAFRMWEDEGRPGMSSNDPGSVGYLHYESSARRALLSLDRMGYRVVKRKRWAQETAP